MLPLLTEHAANPHKGTEAPDIFISIFLLVCFYFFSHLQDYGAVMKSTDKYKAIPTHTQSNQIYSHKVKCSREASASGELWIPREPPLIEEEAYFYLGVLVPNVSTCLFLSHPTTHNTYRKIKIQLTTHARHAEELLQLRDPFRCQEGGGDAIDG